MVMAEKDLRALRNMKDPEAFDDEIFGFHAEQAVEKILKAWLAWRGQDYPKKHDLAPLLQMLEDDGAEVVSYWDLVEYNPFAVQLRYDRYDSTDAPLDREKAITQIAGLFRHVETLLK